MSFCIFACDSISAGHNDKNDSANLALCLVSLVFVSFDTGAFAVAMPISGEVSMSVRVKEFCLQIAFSATDMCDTRFLFSAFPAICEPCCFQFGYCVQWIPLSSQSCVDAMFACVPHFIYFILINFRVFICDSKADQKQRARMAHQSK
jgi:hypothetical protein